MIPAPKAIDIASIIGSPVQNLTTKLNEEIFINQTENQTAHPRTYLKTDCNKERKQEQHFRAMVI
jgi:hypothetical protein